MLEVPKPNTRLYTQEELAELAFQSYILPWFRIFRKDLEFRWRDEKKNVTPS